MKIAIITGTRAEYGLLRPIISEIQKSKIHKLLLYVTGLHMTKYNSSEKNIEFPIHKKIDMKINEKKPDNVSFLNSLSIGIKEFTKELSKDKPDLVILLGDRIEPYSAAIAANFLGVPVAHIHGGDITNGMIDDNIRHSITKLSHLHFVTTEKSEKVILQLGEEKWRVHNVGSPSLDSISNFKPNKKILNELKIPNIPYCLVVYHPESYSNEINVFKKMIDKLISKKYLPVIIYPNLDPGSKKIIQIIDELTKKKKIISFKNLKREEYLSLAKLSSFYIGNSSSGLIELPFIGVKCINIGGRQNGRVSPKSVVHINSISELNEAILKVKKSKESPYWKGGASKKIMKVISNLPKKEILLKKKFITK